VSGHFESLWLYILAPLAGAILAVPACCAFRETGCCSLSPAKENQLVNATREPDETQL